MGFFPPPPAGATFLGGVVSLSGEGECNNSDIGFLADQHLQSQGSGFRPFNGEERHFTGEKRDTVGMEDGEEEEGESFMGGKDQETGQSKLCVRGHWRPAEDTKLRELVARYGPQNWNLIAEKLEGRSGNIPLLAFSSTLDEEQWNSCKFPS